MHLTHRQQAIMLLCDFLNTGAMRQPLKSDFDYLDIRLIDGQKKVWKPSEIASCDTTSRFQVLRITEFLIPARRIQQWRRGISLALLSAGWQVPCGCQLARGLCWKGAARGVVSRAFWRSASPQLIRIFSALETDSPGL
jgi:hypothetical protein